MSDERQRASAEGGAYPALVDAHVHFHPGFDELVFFRSAARNFEAAARRLGVTDSWTAILVLTEIEGQDYFGRLQSRAGQRIDGDLQIVETGEEWSVGIVPRIDSGSLTLIAGRQIQTSEGLEVLGFPLRDDLRDGLPVRAVLTSLEDRRASSVIPWGLGKWWLRRGSVLEELLQARRDEAVGFHLADTRHRPAWAPLPTVLKRWEASGEPTLTGSDPLPLWGECSRAGACCFEIVLDHQDGPARALQRALRTSQGGLRRVESRPGVVSFVAKQAAMQLRKRRSR